MSIMYILQEFTNLFFWETEAKSSSEPSSAQL